MLLLPVAFYTPMHKQEYDLNIEGVRGKMWLCVTTSGRGKGENVIMCYNICDRDCSLLIKLIKLHLKIQSLWQN